MSPKRPLVDKAFLSEISFLGQLEPQDVEKTLRFAKTVRFKAKSIIFNKGDPGDSLYIILKGQVGIGTVSDDGQVIFLNILNVGEMFGEIALLDGGERTAGATALQPTELLRVDRENFFKILRKSPDLCIRLMSILCERLRWTSGIIEDTIFLKIHQRLAKRLLSLMSSHGKPVDGGTRIDVKLSQEKLGNMIGATRESINKYIGLLSDNGVIVYNQGDIVIIDKNRLEYIADLRD